MTVIDIIGRALWGILVGLIIYGILLVIAVLIVNPLNTELRLYFDSIIKVVAVIAGILAALCGQGILRFW